MPEIQHVEKTTPQEAPSGHSALSSAVAGLWQEGASLWKAASPAVHDALPGLGLIEKSSTGGEHPVTAMAAVAGETGSSAAQEASEGLASLLQKVGNSILNPGGSVADAAGNSSPDAANAAKPEAPASTTAASPEAPAAQTNPADPANQTACTEFGCGTMSEQAQGNSNMGIGMIKGFINSLIPDPKDFNETNKAAMQIDDPMTRALAYGEYATQQAEAPKIQIPVTPEQNFGAQVGSWMPTIIATLSAAAEAPEAMKLAGTAATKIPAAIKESSTVSEMLEGVFPHAQTMLEHGYKLYDGGAHASELKTFARQIQSADPSNAESATELKSNEELTERLRVSAVEHGESFIAGQFGATAEESKAIKESIGTMREALTGGDGEMFEAMRKILRKI